MDKPTFSASKPGPDLGTSARRRTAHLTNERPKPASPSTPDARQVDDQSASPPPPRLLDSLRHEIRVRHDSIRTEDAYVD
jgi:hypothetical protein